MASDDTEAGVHENQFSHASAFDTIEDLILERQITTWEELRRSDVYHIAARESRLVKGVKPIGLKSAVNRLRAVSVEKTNHGYKRLSFS